MCEVSEGLLETTLISRVDGTRQPLRYWLSPESRPAAVLVALHTWSFDYTADLAPWRLEAQRRGWCYLQPNFRGPNWTPQACGSQAAMSDIIEAMDWLLARYAQGIECVYLAGASGGGHMAMQTASHYPSRFTAVSEWCGISDLAEWHKTHSKNGQGVGYGQHIEQVVGGAPASSEEVDRELMSRSPLHHLANACKLPIDFNHGVHDGHKGSVPLHHSVRAFNAIARACGAELVGEDEMEELWTRQRLDRPRQGDEDTDVSYGRAIYLRRHAGASRLTIFEGAHECIAPAACHWLAQHTPAGRRPDPKPPAKTSEPAVATISR